MMSQAKLCEEGGHIVIGEYGHVSAGLDQVNADLAVERMDRERSESLRARMEGGNLFVKEKLLSTLYSEDAAESDAMVFAAYASAARA